VKPTIESNKAIGCAKFTFQMVNRMMRLWSAEKYCMIGRELCVWELKEKTVCKTKKSGFCRYKIIFCRGSLLLQRSNFFC
jgi:hypothetical protein